MAVWSFFALGLVEGVFHVVEFRLEDGFPFAEERGEALAFFFVCVIRRCCDCGGRVRNSVDGENGEHASGVLMRGDDDAVDVDGLIAHGQDVESNFVELRFVFVDGGRVGEA